MTALEPLSAPIELQFDYTRSLGPTLGGFLTGLARRQVRRSAGVGRHGVSFRRSSTTRRPIQPLTDFVDVSDRGEVLTWSWAADPLPGQPLERPFAWVLVKLDGADTGAAACARCGLPRRRAHRDAGAGAMGR